MTKEIKIESNVPMNGVGQHNSYRKYSVLFETFDKMDVSQSIVVDEMKKINSIRQYARRFDKTISYRKLDKNAWRIWRTK